MSTGLVSLDTTQYVRVNSGLNPLVLQSHRDQVRIAFNLTKPAKSNTAFHEMSGGDEIFKAPSIATNVWALALTDKASLSVTEYTDSTFQRPLSFSKSTTNTKSVPLQKGQLNKAYIYPRICNEHCESSREVNATVSSGNIVGQIFRASKDNITQLGLTLESAAGAVVDNFESYADNAALQLEWVASTARLATVETTIVNGGLQAMRFDTTFNGDEWVKTQTAQDFTGYTGEFFAYLSEAFSVLQIAVFIGDSLGNTKSQLLVQNDAASWQRYQVNEAAMIEDGGGTTDVADITEIGYRVVTKRPLSFAVIDDVVATPPPGQIGIQLWDMGTDIPVDAVTAIDDGTQYTKIGDNGGLSEFTLNLQGGKRLYHITEFTAGQTKNEPDNELLNEDNYYLITLNYIDTNVDVYGPDTSFNTDYYKSGYAFTAPDTSTAISAIGPYSDLMFHIFSTQDIYVYEARWRFDVDPGENAEISVYLEDKDMQITDMIVDVEKDPEVSDTFQFKEAPMEMKDGSKAEWYYSDDFTDSVDEIHCHLSFYHEPPITHG